MNSQGLTVSAGALIKIRNRWSVCKLSVPVFARKKCSNLYMYV